MQNVNRKTWQKPWTYRESFIISAGLFIIGLFLNYFSPSPLKLPQWPNNVIIGGFFIIFLITLRYIFLKKYIITFLSSIQAAIGAMVLFGLLVLGMGLIPQVDNPIKNSIFGLNYIKQTWLFLISTAYLLTVLFLVIVRRVLPLNVRNIAFACQHLGLWIIIFSAGLASSDLQRYQIPVYEGQTVWYGYNAKGEYRVFPFKIHLNDFRIDEFPAKLAIVHINSDQIDTKIKGNLTLIEKGLELKLLHYNVKVLEYYPMAMEVGDTSYISSQDSLSGQAALLEITDTKSNRTYQGWISSGSPAFKASFVQIGDYYFAMTLPQPKRFSSWVSIYLSNNNTKHFHIEVNKPVHVEGWKLYQIGYDENMGRYSKLSILEAVRDPWLPVVYTGIALLVLGTFYLFWTGNKHIKLD